MKNLSRRRLHRPDSSGQVSSDKHPESQLAGCPSERCVQKVPEIRIIASHELAPEVIGTSVFTLISTCPGVPVSGPRCQVSGRQAPDSKAETIPDRSWDL